MVLDRMIGYWQKPFRQKVDTVLNRCELLADSVYEKRKGLDFGGHVPANELIVEGNSSRGNASANEPISSLACRAVIDEAIQIGGALDNFVEVGCGKGKTCICAARHFPFKK